MTGTMGLRRVSSIGSDMSAGTISTAGMTASSGAVPSRSLLKDGRYGGRTVESIDERKAEDGDGGKRRKGRSRSLTRSTLKTVGRSFRSRSPFRSSGSKKNVEVEGSGKIIVVETAPSKKASDGRYEVPTVEKQERRRSRTRSPLRKAVDVVKTVSKVTSKAAKTTTKKAVRTASKAGRRRSSKDFSEMDEGLVPLSSVNEEDFEEMGEDDSSVLARAESSYHAYADDDASVASSVTVISTSSPTAPSSTVLGTIGATPTPLLPSLLPEPENYSEEPSIEVMLEEKKASSTETLTTSWLAATPQVPQVPKVEKVRSRKNTKKARKPEKITRTPSPTSVITRLDLPKLSLKKSRKPSSPPVSHVRVPLGLGSRTSSASIIRQLKAGSGASEAVRQLREHQCGIVPKSFRSPKGKLSYSTVMGIKVPDYAGYVEESVSCFRRKIGVSDREYEGVKEGLLGWVYQGSRR